MGKHIQKLLSNIAIIQYNGQRENVFISPPVIIIRYRFVLLYSIVMLNSIQQPGKMFVGYLARGVVLIQFFHKPIQLLVPLLCLADFLLALLDGLFLVLVGRFPDALCKLLFIVPHIPAHALNNGKYGGFYV